MSNYYEQNGKAYIEDTFKCDVSLQYSFFEKHLNNPKSIMDLGFGSGRDSLYFISKGYDVYAVDPTKAFCENAKSLGIKNVYNLYAQDIEFDNLFDGIWACASLLHVPSNELNTVFKKCAKALHNNGIMYISFKYGDFEGERNGREFLDLNEKSLKIYLKNSGLSIIDMAITEDVRPEKTTKWLNAVLRKE